MAIMTARTAAVSGSNPASVEATPYYPPPCHPQHAFAKRGFRPNYSLRYQLACGRFQANLDGSGIQSRPNGPSVSAANSPSTRYTAKHQQVWHRRYCRSSRPATRHGREPAKVFFGRAAGNWHLVPIVFRAFCNVPNAKEGRLASWCSALHCGVGCSDYSIALKSSGDRSRRAVNRSAPSLKERLAMPKIADFRALPLQGEHACEKPN